ncbi:DUF6555 family protein [Pseudomonas sp. NPDC007930]|uniref:DUF6555 family protein n=1 Tax=Pseudomonas sp. NPDC007930 TaxID=3364417 RepID=UPI0036E0E533
MPSPKLFIIDYRLHGSQKSFVLRHDHMDNAEAWHWASCDAGIGHIARNRHDKIKKTSKPMAEKYGITDVTWREAGASPLEGERLADAPAR